MKSLTTSPRDHCSRLSANRRAWERSFFSQIWFRWIFRFWFIECAGTMPAEAHGKCSVLKTRTNGTVLSFSICLTFLLIFTTNNLINVHESSRNKWKRCTNKNLNDNVYSFLYSLLPHVLQNLINQYLWVVVQSSSPPAPTTPMIQFLCVTCWRSVDAFHPLQPDHLGVQLLSLLLSVVILQPLHPEEGRVVARWRGSQIVKRTAGSSVGGANRLRCFRWQVPLRSATRGGDRGTVRTDAGEYPSNHPPKREYMAILNLLLLLLIILLNKISKQFINKSYY